MRYIITILSLMLSLPFCLWAQPANDDCANSQFLTLGDCGMYDNVSANTDVAQVNFTPIGLNCPSAENEVWFHFTAPNPPVDIQITVTGMDDGGTSAMQQPSITLIRGECLEFEAAACVEAAAGSNFAELVIPETAFFPGLDYYILVSDWSATAGSNEGAFELCVAEYIPPPDLCAASSTTDCSGTVYDTGGESGNYGPNENCVFTITPTAFNQCIVATVNFYDLEAGFDFLNFYNGDNTGAPLINSVTGLGGNLEIQASGGSLTIEFLSNASVENQGFDISWTCTTDACTVLTPVDVDANVTVDDLVDALSTPQVVVSNPVLNCPNGSFGTYVSTGNTQLDNMGLGNGIVLSSGLAEDAENPENFFASTIMGVPGDADLDLLSTVNGGANSNDACILEFDVYAATDELEFKYVFGSEEYPNFVGSTFNDIFAFFISGPGIVPNTPVGLHNMAVLQDGTPVEINTVNFNTPFDPVTGDLVYNDNAGGLSLPYGGYTSVLTARADVIPCNIYHLKLAIADRGDSSYDSGVFLADLQAGLPELQLVFDINSANGDNILVEGCSDGDYIDAILTNPSDNNITYYLQVEGVADENTDLTQPIPDSLVAPPGTTTIQIPFVPVNDGVDEGGVETFGLQVFAVFQCDTVVYDSVSISIYDEIDISPDQDTFFVCSGTSVQLGVSGATGYTWDWPIPSELDNPNLSNPTITPTQSGWIYVSGIINTNSACTDMDSAYVQIIDPTIQITSPPPFICEGESTTLTALTNTNNTGISWSPTGDLSCTDCANPSASPETTTTYTATVTAGGCSASADVTVTVDPLGVPGIIPDTDICEGESIILATAPTGTGSMITSYAWTPNDGSLNDATLPDPTATPSVTTTYTVVATSQNGVCSNTQQVTINVFPATIDITGPDTIYWCDSDMNSITLNANTIVDPSTVQWSDSGGGTWPDGGSIDVAPTNTTTYTATISIGACTNSADLTIQVDSLPNMDLNVLVPDQGIAELNPDTVDICSDPSQTLFVSNVYNASLYPDITHTWLENGMMMDPPQNAANMFDNLPSAVTTYTILTTNNACEAIDSFVVDVNTPPTFGISPLDTTVCLGQSVQLEAVGATDFSWTPNDGSLSATDISNPIATPTQTTQYVASATVNGCQVGVAATITVIQPPSITLVEDQFICTGTTVSLGDDGNDPGLTYQWSNGLSGSNPSVTPTETTTYTVAVTNGSCGTTDEVTITVESDLALAVTGDLNICQGESTNLFANTQGAVFWYDAAGTLLGTNPSLVVSPTATTTYTVNATTGDCASSETVTVTVSATPELVVGTDQNVCIGESATITANTDLGMLAWSPANEFADPTAGTQTVSPNATTTYVVTADNNGCIAQDEVTVSINPSPVYEVAQNQTICLGGAVTLGLVQDANTQYTWTANPADPSLTNPTSALASVSPIVDTEYTLTATNGICTETATVMITVVDPSLTVTPEATICYGERTLLEALGLPEGGTYTWTDWEGNVIGTSDSIWVAPTSTEAFGVTYNVNGCSLTEISEVTVIDYFDVWIATDPAGIVPTGTDMTLTAMISGTLPDGAAYTWTDANGNVISTDASVMVTLDQESTYTVTVTSPNGCTATASITITPYFQRTDFANAFTPNGDEDNDRFYPIVGLNVNVVEFKVFDRWGELVHDNPGLGWDGTLNGKILPSDVYVYFARIVDANGNETFHKGGVTLLR